MFCPNWKRDGRHAIARCPPKLPGRSELHLSITTHIFIRGGVPQEHVTSSLTGGLPCGWICLLRPARARQVPAGRVAAPTRRHLSLLTGVMSLRRLDSWPDLPVFAGVSLARAAALLWHRNRPTVSVSCKWTGLAVETDEAQSGESVQKTRQVPPVGRTLCWADAC